MRIMFNRYILFCLAFVFCENGLAADSFKLSLKRSNRQPGCTIGSLEVDGQFKLVTLELPYNDNAENNSSIPTGTYSGILRYDHSDQWRIELENVPGRKNVQIHIGNYPRDTKGCILVGLQTGAGSCEIAQSKEAFAKLRNAFYGSDHPNATPNKKIILTVE